MIVLNTVAHFYPQLDRPAKSGKSNTRAGKKEQPKSAKSESGRSRKSGQTDDAGEAPRLILSPQVVQTFIYNYINEKLKHESQKISLLVDAKFEKFLTSLPQPLELNAIRTMKEDKYEQMRGILSRHTGSPVLKLIRDNQEELGLDPDVFDLVYEGFWDLYTLKPKCKDVSADRLRREWIKKVALRAGESKEGDAAAEEGKEDKPEGEGDEEKAEGEEDAAASGDEEKKEPVDEEDVIEPVSAIVQVKIGKIRPEVQQDEEGNDIVVEYTEEQLDEFDDVVFEDKVLSFDTQKDDKKIWVLNHQAAKTLRGDIATEFRAVADKLDSVDATDFNFRMDKEAKAFEAKFLKLFSDDSKANAPKVPVFSYRPDL